MPKTNGAGSIYKRGNMWWVQVYVDGRPIIESSGSKILADAKKHRDKLLGKKTRGEVTGGVPDKVLIGELLNDALKSDIEESTRYIWTKVIEKNIRPFFGNMRAARLSTDLMDQYRAKRKAEGRSDATANRELSILRTAFHNARKRTPPKVNSVPYFPMVQETNVRQGFLSDDQYSKLLGALDEGLRPLFVCAYNTGIRKGELLQLQWEWVDFERERIALPPQVTKAKKGRAVPIMKGDMLNLLLEAKRHRDEGWPDSPWVFSRGGERILDFRGAWDRAAKAAGVPEIKFHDLRRTAVRNMRRAGVPQALRMKISGHATDSMERRYNIVDDEDLDIAKRFMETRLRVDASASPSAAGD